MLVLTRKDHESVVVGRVDEMEVVLEITILAITGGRVRLGFNADSTTAVYRREVWERIRNGNGNGHADGNGDGNGHSAHGAPQRAESLPVQRHGLDWARRTSP